MSETFHIGLGNNHPEIRQRSESDFTKFWDDQATGMIKQSVYHGLNLGLKRLIGILLLQNGLKMV